MDIKYSGVSSVELDMLTFTGNVKGYLLTGRAQPFLLLGAGLMRFELDDRVGLGIHEKGDGFAARFGGDVVTQGTSFSLSIRATCFQPAMRTT